MNYIDELSKYYRIWSRKYSSDKIHKFTTPDVAIAVLLSGAWYPDLTATGRVCATDKAVLTTFSYNVTTSIVFYSELFYYMDYLKVYSEIAKYDSWVSPDGHLFLDTTMVPWESEFYSTKPVPIDYIEEIIVYLRTSEDLNVRDVVLLRNKCEELGIKFSVDMHEIIDALAIPCACELFDKLYYVCEYFGEIVKLIKIKNYPDKMLWYNSPLSLDFCWLVDYEHGCEHPEPNYKYGEKFMDEITTCVMGYPVYYTTCLNLIAERFTKREFQKQKLKRKINRFFNIFCEIYFGKSVFE